MPKKERSGRANVRVENPVTPSDSQDWAVGENLGKVALNSPRRSRLVGKGARLDWAGGLN